MNSTTEFKPNEDILTIAVKQLYDSGAFSSEDSTPPPKLMKIQDQDASTDSPLLHSALSTSMPPPAAAPPAAAPPAASVAPPRPDTPRPLAVYGAAPATGEADATKEPTISRNYISDEIDVTKPLVLFSELPVADKDEAKKKPAFVWRTKPTLIGAKTFDLTPSGLKFVAVGVENQEGYPIRVVLGKLDLPNGFLVMTHEEWTDFKAHFDIFTSYYCGELVPPGSIRLNDLTFKFRALFSAPSLIITGPNDGKFVMQEVVFERLKSLAYAVDLALRGAVKTMNFVHYCKLQQRTTIEIQSAEEELIYEELVLIDAATKKPAKQNNSQ